MAWTEGLSLNWNLSDMEAGRCWPRKEYSRQSKEYIKSLGREPACSRHYTGAEKWEDATLERRCGAGGGGSYKTLWVVQKTLDFIPSWIDAESFKWWCFQIRMCFWKHIPDWVCRQVTGDQGRKEILLIELEWWEVAEFSNIFPCRQSQQNLLTTGCGVWRKEAVTWAPVILV